MYAFRFQPAQALFSSCVGTASCGGRSGGQGGIQGSTLRYLYPPPARGIEVKGLWLVMVSLSLTIHNPWDITFSLATPLAN